MCLKNVLYINDHPDIMSECWNASKLAIRKQDEIYNNWIRDKFNNLYFSTYDKNCYYGTHGNICSMDIYYGLINFTGIKYNEINSLEKMTKYLVSIIDQGKYILFDISMNYIKVLNCIEKKHDVVIHGYYDSGTKISMATYNKEKDRYVSYIINTEELFQSLVYTYTSICSNFDLYIQRSKKLTLATVMELESYTKTYNTSLYTFCENITFELKGRVSSEIDINCQNYYIYSGISVFDGIAKLLNELISPMECIVGNIKLGRLLAKIHEHKKLLYRIVCELESDHILINDEVHIKFQKLICLLEISYILAFRYDITKDKNELLKILDFIKDAPDLYIFILSEIVNATKQYIFSEL